MKTNTTEQLQQVGKAIIGVMMNYLLTQAVVKDKKNPFTMAQMDNILCEEYN